MRLQTRDSSAVVVILFSLTLCFAAAPEAFAQGAPSGEREAATARRRAARRSSGNTPAGKRRASPPAEEDGRAARFVDEGLRHADGGDWAEAIKSYRQALAVNPRHADAHIYLGDAYMSSGKYEEAFAAYREAVRVAPSNAEAHYALGAAYNDMAQYGDAFKPLVRAVSLDAGHAEALHGIGYAYLKLENFRDALPYLKRAVAARPGYAEAHLSLGLAYLGLRQTKAAEQQLKLLAETDAALAVELDKEMRGAAGLARAAEPVTPQPGESETAAAPAPKLVGVITPRQSQKTEAASQAAPSPSLLAVELSFWDSIKNSNDPAEFDAYLKKYPEGEFAELARIRLRALAAKRGEAAAPRPTPTPDPLAETLESLRREFPNRFTYKATVPGEGDGAAPVTTEVSIEYEPLRFEGCRLEWREAKDVLSVSLADLDPLGVKVEERSRPDTTFSVPVWNLSLATTDARHLIRESKGDGSGAVNNYNGLDLQFADRAKAETLARLIQTAIKLCADGPRNQ